MKKPRIFSVIAIASFSLLLTSCSAGGTTPPSEKSGNSGQMTLYSPAAAEFASVLRHFNEDYPDIKVNPVTLVGSELGTRLQSEITSGQAVGDVVMTSTTSSAGPWIKEQQDWFVPYIPEGAKNLRSESLSEEEGWFSPFSSVFGAAYNTEAVSADEVPRTWDELLNPKWDGRIALGEPRRQSVTTVAFVGLLGSGTIDEQWFSELNKLNPRPSETPQVQQSLVSGQSDLAIWGLGYASSAKAEGAPIEFIPELGVESLNGAALLKSAPNPDAAKVFLDWSVSENGQKAFSESGFMPQVEGAPKPVGMDDGMKMPIVPPFEESSVLTKEVIETWSQLLE